MDEAKKRQLVDYSKKGCTLEGSPTTVAGLKNDEASLAPHFGGFWRVSWETVERVVLSDDRNFVANENEAIGLGITMAKNTWPRCVDYQCVVEKIPNEVCMEVSK